MPEASAKGVDPEVIVACEGLSIGTAEGDGLGNDVAPFALRPVGSSRLETGAVGSTEFPIVLALLGFPSSLRAAFGAGVCDRIGIEKTISMRFVFCSTRAVVAGCSRKEIKMPSPTL